MNRANATLARVGMDLEEKIGAAVNTASIRKNGQMMGEIHAIKWASDNVITMV